MTWSRVVEREAAINESKLVVNGKFFNNPNPYTLINLTALVYSVVFPQTPKT